MALWGLGKLLTGFFLLVQVYGQVKHDLPDNLEIVDPKSLGLAGADLDKFLGNVKLLPISGNNLLPKDSNTKTQILTVGFEGDEGLNLDDFELPSVDGLPDAEKTVAQAAFNRFQEFFKNPNKSKTIIDDEDLIEDRFTVLTTTSTTTTTPTPLTTQSNRRPIYRPRAPAYTTTTPNPNSYLNRNRNTKVKRPGRFRSTTTTPSPTTTEYVSESYTTIPPQNIYKTENSYNQKSQSQGQRAGTFQPEQFQDYASIIRDLQSTGPRNAGTGTGGDGSEGAPNGFLGFKAVHEPGHKGPPIFEFGGSSSPAKSKPKVRPTTIEVPVVQTSTTERHTSTNINSQLIDYSKPNSNSNNGGSRYTPLTNRQQGNAPPTDSPVTANPNVEPTPRKVKPTFEQISAEPVGHVQHVSAKVPIRYSDEELQLQYEQRQFELIQQQKLEEQLKQQHQQEQIQLEQQREQQRQQQQRQQQASNVQNQTPQQQHQYGQRITSNSNQNQNQHSQNQAHRGTSAENFSQLQSQDQQLRFIQEQYQKQQQDQFLKQKQQEQQLYELQQKLKIQEERSQQLQNQLKLQQQQQLQKQQEQQLQLQKQQQQQQLHNQQKQQQLQQQQLLNQQKQQQLQQQQNQNAQQQHQHQQLHQIHPQQVPQQYSTVRFPGQPPLQQIHPVQVPAHGQILPFGQPAQIPHQHQPQSLPSQQVPYQQRPLSVQLPLVQIPIQQQQYRSAVPVPAPAPGPQVQPVHQQQLLRPNTFANQPLIVPNQNFLRPHINEKFYTSMETPKHIVRNPINLFAGNAAPKTPQIFPLSTIENVVQPNFSPSRFVIPPNQSQQQPQSHRPPQTHHHQQQQSQPQSSQSSQLTRPQTHQFAPPTHPHQFAARSLENAEGNSAEPRRQHSKRVAHDRLNIQPASLIGTFSLAPSSTIIESPSDSSSSSSSELASSTS